MVRGFRGEAEFPITRIVQSKPVYCNNLNITSAKLTADITIQDTDQIIFYLGVSATVDGTYTFEEVTNGVSHYFVAEGKWLKWRARLNGYVGDSTYFENLKVYVE